MTDRSGVATTGASGLVGPVGDSSSSGGEVQAATPTAAPKASTRDDKDFMDDDPN
jgi:hypothetical protein